MRYRSVLFGVLLAVPALFCGQVFACGPYLEKAVFTGALNPDAPLEEYFQGRLGIFQPTYARSYLVVAYRYIAGGSLGEAERNAVLKLVNKRIGAYYYFSEFTSDSQESPALKEWTEARAQVIKKGDPPGAMKDAGYYYFRNCLDDAFTTAARTLREKVKRFGAASPQATEWVKTQDEVFANCSGGEVIPRGSPAAVDTSGAADRAYQVAAAHFYAGHFDKAAELFGAIAEGPASEWKQIAPYLRGRALLRKALSDYAREQGADSKKEKTEAKVREPFGSAEQQFLQVLERPDLSALHPAARGMLNLIRFRTDPDAKRSELAVSLLSDAPGEQIEQDLADYTRLLDRFRARYLEDEYEDIEYGNEAETPEAKAERDRKMEAFIAALNGVDDLTDWIFTFQSDDGRALEHALQRYEEKGSVPWLVAVLSKITPEDPRFLAVFDHALKIEKDSPAYLCVGFHMARCLLLAGKPDEARGKADELLSVSTGATARSSTNLLLSLRMSLARNLDEFLQYAQRVPVRILEDRDFPYARLEGGASSDIQGSETRLREPASGKPLLDTDSVVVFNEMLPLQLWVQAVESPVLPEHLRLMLARTAWVRAVLLDREDTAAMIAAFLKDRDGELTSFLSTYLGARQGEPRKSAAIYTILKNPGLQPYLSTGLGRLTPVGAIDNYRNNWWCALNCSGEPGENRRPGSVNYYAEGTVMSRPMKSLYSGGKMVYPVFVSSADRQTGKSERQTLLSLGAAPNYLTGYVVSAARGNSSIPDLPEALHLSVRSTRYGCVTDETTKHSKAAFEILHKKYPQNPWTKKTPYWF
jgi:hypothetical protein